MVTSRVDKLAADYEHLPVCANAKIWNLARELEKQNAQMLGALEKCRSVFAEYVKIHKAKIPEFQPAIFPSPFAEVEEKIRRNQEMVDICDAAIRAAKGEA